MTLNVGHYPHYNSKCRISGGNQRCENCTHFVTASKSYWISFPSSDVARWPRTQYYLVFLLTVQTINNHWESSLHQSQGWPGQSSQPMIVSTLRKEVLLPSQLSIDDRYGGNEDRTEQILESNWLLKIFEKFSVKNTVIFQHVDKMIYMYIHL